LCSGIVVTLPGKIGGNMYDWLKDNKHAEKWTFEAVNELLNSMLDTAKNEKHYFIGSLLVHYDIATSTWDYLKDKFTGQERSVVLELIKKIESVTESNLMDGALTGKTKETASIFLLKCKYGYQDKQVIEHDHKGTIAINLNFADTEPDNE
jgi:hypothetical protein